MIARFQRRAARFIILLLRDVALIQHARQHHIATRQRAAVGVERVKGRRRFGQTGDHRHFAQRKLVYRLAEVHLRGGADAIGAIAEIDLVQIELEDLIFIQQLLNANGEKRLLDFAHQRTLRAQEEVTRQLLRNGARAL